MMELRIVLEAGHTQAVTGSAMSYQEECPLKEVVESSYVSTKRMKLLGGMDGGHNKFLESIMVWVDMRLSQKMWKQFDTYRMCTKQSKSTMHTIMKRALTKDDFDAYIPVGVLAELNDHISKGQFVAVCDNLPMSYLQTRRVCLSYKTIRNIILQRQNHKLYEWQVICAFFLQNLKHPDLLGIQLNETKES